MINFVFNFVSLNSDICDIISKIYVEFLQPFWCGESDYYLC